MIFGNVATSPPPRPTQRARHRSVAHPWHRRSASRAPTATRQAVATPAPAATPVSVAARQGSIGDLAQQAEAAFQRAQDALRNNDFATYGAEINRAQQLIQQIAQQTQGR